LYCAGWSNVYLHSLLLCRCRMLLRPFYQLPLQSMQLCWAKTIFPEPNRHILTFPHSVLVCRIIISIYIYIATEHWWRCSL
jgi:hypothetical protein